MFKLIFILALMLVVAGSALAQTTPPPPTITIPVNDIFNQMNNWITVIAPIFAIGIGISLAFAVLGFIGSILVSAFRGRFGGSK